MYAWHRTQLNDFLTALALLTRLGPAKRVDPGCITRSVPWYPVVGACVGAFCILPLALGLGNGQPWLQAWIYIGCGLWFTRCLHWD